MREFKYIIHAAEGIHVRPAGELVKITKGFTSDIKIIKGNKIMNGKSVLGITGLGVKAGEEIVMTFDGEDEDAAYEAVKEYVLAQL